MSTIGAYDIAGVNKWALAQRLTQGDKFFAAEIGGVTWYIDNYCARAVPETAAYVKAVPATDGITRNIRNRTQTTEEVELHDTGLIRRSEIKGKPDITIWETDDGTQVGVREDFAKLAGKKGKLYGGAQDPANSAICIRVDGVPSAVIMPVRIRKEESK